jgi:hypothetical protein
MAFASILVGVVALVFATIAYFVDVLELCATRRRRKLKKKLRRQKTQQQLEEMQNVVGIDNGVRKAEFFVDQILDVGEKARKAKKKAKREERDRKDLSWAMRNIEVQKEKQRKEQDRSDEQSPEV